MKVMFVTHRFPPDGFGGVERVTQFLASELAARGDQVSVVCCRPQPDYGPAPLRERSPDGFDVYRYLGGPAPVEGFLLRHEVQERRFAKTLGEVGPEVVHFMHLLDLSPRSIELAGKSAAVVLALHDFYLACPLVNLRQPTGALCDGPDGGRECARACFAREGERAPLRWGMRAAYFRRLLALADRIVCPSAYVRSFFERFGADPGRVRVVPNGVALPPGAGHLTPGGRPAGGLRLAVLGSVGKLKGLHALLDALRLAGLEAVDLLVAGAILDADYAAEMSRRAAAVPGLRMRMSGAYEVAEVPSLLSGADCVVAPSVLPETFAIVAREALALGLPVLVSRLGALPDAVREGQNGFTFDPARPRELAALLRRLAGDEALLARLRDGARRTPVVGVAEHAAAVRGVHAEALAARSDRPLPSPADAAEFDFMHEALVRLGFDPAHRQGARRQGS